MVSRARLASVNAVLKERSRLSEALARAIKRHRSRQRLSQEALAEAAGVHHTYVGLVERGERNPTIDVAERLARALGVKLSTLIAEAERRKTLLDRRKKS